MSRVLALVVFAACYRPGDYASCTVSCDLANAAAAPCPAGLACSSAGLCVGPTGSCAGDAGASDGPIDAVVDAAAVPLDGRIGPSCVPTRFATSTFVDGAINVQEIAVPSGLPTFAIVSQTNSFASLSLSMGASATAIGGLTVGVSHPAITPDASTLFFLSAGDMSQSSNAGTANTWGPIVHVTIADLVTPGTPSLDPNNDLRMIGGTASGLEEVLRSHSSGAWVRVRAVNISATAGKGTVVYPGLSPDGLVLVFALTASVSDGIYFASRASTNVPFVLATPPANQLAAGSLVSPVLSADCEKLYTVSAGTAKGLLFHH